MMLPNVTERVRMSAGTFIPEPIPSAKHSISLQEILEETQKELTQNTHDENGSLYVPPSFPQQVALKTQLNQLVNSNLRKSEFLQQLTREISVVKKAFKKQAKCEKDGQNAQVSLFQGKLHCAIEDFQVLTDLTQREKKSLAIWKERLESVQKVYETVRTGHRRAVKAQETAVYTTLKVQDQITSFSSQMKLSKTEFYTLFYEKRLLKRQQDQEIEDLIGTLTEHKYQIHKNQQNFHSFQEALAAQIHKKELARTVGRKQKQTIRRMARALSVLNSVLQAESKPPIEKLDLLHSDYIISSLKDLQYREASLGNQFNSLTHEFLQQQKEFETKYKELDGLVASADREAALNKPSTLGISSEDRKHSVQTTESAEQLEKTQMNLLFFISNISLQCTQHLEHINYFSALTTEHSFYSSVAELKELSMSFSRDYDFFGTLFPDKSPQLLSQSKLAFFGSLPIIPYQATSFSTDCSVFIRTGQARFQTHISALISRVISILPSASAPPTSLTTATQRPSHRFPTILREKWTLRGQRSKEKQWDFELIAVEHMELPARFPKKKSVSKKAEEGKGIKRFSSPPTPLLQASSHAELLKDMMKVDKKISALEQEGKRAVKSNSEKLIIASYRGKRGQLIGSSLQKYRRKPLSPGILGSKFSPN